MCNASAQRRGKQQVLQANDRVAETASLAAAQVQSLQEALAEAHAGASKLHQQNEQLREQVGLPQMVLLAVLEVCSVLMKRGYI